MYSKLAALSCLDNIQSAPVITVRFKESKSLRHCLRRFAEIGSTICPIEAGGGVERGEEQGKEKDGDEVSNAQAQGK